MDATGALLRRLGARVRARRKELDLTAAALAERAGLSRRFVAQVEAGEGNIAIGRLHDVATALDTTIEALVTDGRAAGPRRAIERLVGELDPDQQRRALQLLQLAFGHTRPHAIALLGVRGAGKSSVGPQVAAALEMRFVELDEQIEAAAGLSLAEIFALHGEPYYRRLEARCLLELLASGEPVVIALPGGLIGNDDAWEHVRQRCTCVWLKARPEDHMARVLAQGDQRPMADRADAMEELRGLMAAREPVYAQADVIVDTSHVPLADVVERVLSALESGR